LALSNPESIVELPTAEIELDIPKVGKKPTKEQMDNLRKAGEAIAQKCDENILQALHEPSKFPHLETVKLGRSKITDYEWEEE
jgi:hypothetical protein